MKQWITLLAASALTTACSKQDLQQEESKPPELRTSALRTTQGGAYVSDWESNSAWTKVNNGNISTFTWTRKTPEINAGVLNGGLVLTYAKAASADPAYEKFSRPNMMPFHFLPEAERPNLYAYTFADETTAENVTIKYNSPYTKEAMPQMGGSVSLGGIQFQYVVLPKSFLDNQNLTAQMVRNYYTYDQVMNLINQ